MKAYSIALREKIVAAHIQEKISIRQVAIRFTVSKSLVQKLRTEYWEKIRDLEPDNLVFLDETGVLLGLARTHARSPSGTRVYELKPFYRGAKVTVIGAISMKKVGFFGTFYAKLIIEMPIK